jgi:hypothetical protein
VFHITALGRSCVVSTWAATMADMVLAAPLDKGEKP